jgi:hypothetical protein
MAAVYRKRAFGKSRYAKTVSVTKKIKTTMQGTQRRGKVDRCAVNQKARRKDKALFFVRLCVPLWFMFFFPLRMAALYVAQGGFQGAMQIWCLSPPACTTKDGFDTG